MQSSGGDSNPGMTGGRTNTSGGRTNTTGESTTDGVNTGGKSASGGAPPLGGSSGSTSGGSVSVGGSGGQTDTCHGEVLFSFTGVAQDFTVPACAKSLIVEALGAEGGTAFNRTGDNPVGGLGARVMTTFTVTGGELLRVYVGGRGNDGSAERAGRGGWNGGGTGGYTQGGTWTAAAAGGGGGSDVRRGGASLESRIVVAAGGGGASGNCSTDSVRPAGGDGGTLSGGNGGLCYEHPESAGLGGSDVGGEGGDFDGCVSGAGSQGQGGSACAAGGGGGGGGFFGGGAGAWGGGGGGSSFVHASGRDVVQTAGVHAGNGQVTLRW